MRQVDEWVQFYRREPWGFEAEDMRNALLALVTAQAAGAKHVKLEMFRLTPRLPEDEAADEEFRLAKQIRAAFGIAQSR